MPTRPNHVRFFMPIDCASGTLDPYSMTTDLRDLELAPSEDAAVFELTRIVPNKHTPSALRLKAFVRETLKQNSRRKKPC